MKRFKGMFKGWNAFEQIMFAISFAVPIAVGIVFKSGIIEITATVLSLLAALFIAKGKIMGYFICLIAYPLFIIVCFHAHAYGEAIACLALYYPMVFISIFAWARKQYIDKTKGKVVKVGHVGAKELAILIASQIVMSIGYWFLLSALNTEHLVVAVISVAVQVIAGYLLARRSQFGLGPFCFGDIAQIVLWSLVVASGNAAAVATLIMPCIYFIIDIFGFIEWQRLKKSQKKDVQNSD